MWSRLKAMDMSDEEMDTEDGKIKCKTVAARSQQVSDLVSALDAKRHKDMKRPFQRVYFET